MKESATKTSPKASKSGTAQAASPVPEQAQDLSHIQSSLTGGSSLPRSTRERLEQSFGTSLGHVKIHTGSAAATATKAVSAEAFASGPNIAFSPGSYRPGTPAGDHLITEEVAHVVQQKGSGGQVLQRHALVSSPHDSAEVSARAAADNVAAGRPANLSMTGLSTRGRIMRRAKVSGGVPSPVVSTPATGLGTTKPASVPVLTPVMTSTITSAGGRLVDSAGRQAAKKGTTGEAKSPDEAQTVQPAAGASPTGVLVAGTPAGGPPDKAAAGGGEKKGKKEKKSQDQGEGEKKEEASQEEQATPARPGGGVAKFGRIKGDRGAGAAAAATRRLNQRAAAVATTETAGVRIGAARAAAAPPPNAAEASGQELQTQTLENAEVSGGDAQAARQTSRQAVAANTPGTIEDLENFASAGSSARQPLSDAIAGEAAAQTAPVSASLSAIDTPPMGATPPPPVPQPEPMTAPESAAPDLTTATPPPANEDALDASEFQDQADSALAEHDAGDETLARADEGPLRAVGDDKNELNTKVEAAGSRARATEAAARTNAGSALTAAETAGQSEMSGGREMGQTAVSGEQETTRTGDETSEQSLADQITTTYQTAQTEVNTKLASLSGDAVQEFNTSQGTLLEAFGRDVRSDLADLKRRRYAGVRGALRRARDWLLSINSVPSVKRLYQRHRDAYIANIDGLITSIKTKIDTTITECKTALKTAREAISKLVIDNESQMGEAERAALERATAGFARMESQISQAADAAKKALDAQRQRAIDAMDAELDNIRSENAGLVDKVANAIAAVADALGKFMTLMTRITRMGIGSFLGAALGQAKEGVQNNLWDQLQEAFKQWIFMKVPALQLLLSLPSNWIEMITALSTNMIGLFIENLPAMLPAIGVAAMVWLATTLAAKLIPGVGAIMAVIDAVRGAYALVQSLFTAATAFFEFVMKVAERGNGAVAFARALAFGIVAAVDAILTFLGVDRLIRRVLGAIARPFGRVINSVMGRFRAFMARRRQRRRGRSRSRGGRQRDGGRGGSGANARRSARSRARNQRRNRRRRRTAARRRPGRTQRRPRTASSRRQDRNRRRQERKMRRWRRGMAAVRRGLAPDRGRQGVRPAVRRAWLALLKIRYRFRELRLVKQGSRYKVRAGMSPSVVVDDSDTIDESSVRPLWPAGLKPLRSFPRRVKRFRASTRGNIRLRSFDNPQSVQVQFGFHTGASNPNVGSWRFESVNQLGAQGEALVRQKLAQATPEYLSVLNSGHRVNAPGFDNAGLRNESGVDGEDGSRFEIGEVKTSRRTGYHAPGKFTAITSNFSQNMDQTMAGIFTGQGARIAERAESTVRAGNIDFIVHLVGGARVSMPKRIILRRNILNSVRAYLRAKGLSRRDAAKAAKNVRVRYQGTELP